ncbi:nickel transporter permease [Halococcus sp. IIIV-5B]|uniref:nickel transporter permease n=1 Tax=Halococcus sp. IIIV-5B TaxID=2321230 RepID=UPI000E72D15F|nr:nickel transporter permease [Halococcus sp. IIIV-5B]RJT07425.1 ABC transporter permease [Halococcus sp. IIIV-5B]
MTALARSRAVGRRTRRAAGRLSKRVRRNPLLYAGGTVVLLLGASAVFGPLLTPYGPAEQHVSAHLQPPSVAHPLGTDQFGRDVLTRLVYGARVSLGIAVAVTTIRLGVGTAVGSVAGYAGGRVDEGLMRLVDLQLAFPGFVLALVVAGVLGPSLRNVTIALAAVGWGTYARVVRGTVLSVKHRRYVDAARLVATPRRRVFRRHLLPSVLDPVLVLATLNLGTVIVASAGLSFVGLGAQPPTAEWGTMLSEGREYLRSAWWLVNAPGGAIVLTVLGFNLLGDGLRDRLDPHQQTRIQRAENR